MKIERRRVHVGQTLVIAIVPNLSVIWPSTVEITFDFREVWM